MRTLNISLFRSYSSEGRKLEIDLSKELVPYLRKELNIETTFTVYDSEGLSPWKGNSPFKVLYSAFNNDIVLIDASIEEVEGKILGVNYECITPAASSMDNIILLSRTQLPLNFIACRTNVAAIGEYDKLNPENNKGGYMKWYDNDMIIEWLKNELRKMNEHNHLIRPSEWVIDTTLPYFEIMKKEQKVMKECMKGLIEERGKKKKIFISYRSRYCPTDDNEAKYLGKYNVEDVAAKIMEHHRRIGDVEEWDTPFYYPHGVLSNEFMPEIRRWGFVSIPDRKIRECKEFWIFDTKYKPGEVFGGKEEVGYWDSWWCLGEFVTIMRMNSDRQLPPDFRIMIFDPDSDKISELPRERIPKVSAEENRELARYFANGDFLESGLETMSGMRKKRLWPKFVRKMLYNFMEKYVWPQIGTNGEFNNMKFEYYEESVWSHVYDKSFTENRILVCHKCAQQGKTMEDVLGNKNIVWDFLNINNYYSQKGLHNVETNKEVVQFTERELKRFKKHDGSFLLKCNNGHQITIRKSDDHFYLYWTPRRGKHTGPNNCVIEKVDLYEIV